MACGASTEYLLNQVGTLVESFGGGFEACCIAYAKEKQGKNLTKCLSLSLNPKP